jgi:hypothetical protein
MLPIGAESGEVEVDAAILIEINAFLLPRIKKAIPIRVLVQVDRYLDRSKVVREVCVLIGDE